MSYSSPESHSRSSGRSDDSRPARSGGPFAKKGFRADAEKKPDPILFQTFFKSVGPRTYATQLKRAANGNHYLVFTEGKRDKVTDEVRKTSLYLYSEDFVSYFRMLKEMAEYVKANPVPADIAKKQARFWERNGSEASKKTAQIGTAPSSAPTLTPPPAKVQGPAQTQSPAQIKSPAQARGPSTAPGPASVHHPAPTRAPGSR